MHIGLTSFVILFLFAVIVTSANIPSSHDVIEDHLPPYTHHHGSAHSHRTIRSLQPAHYQGLLHEDYPAPYSSPKSPLVETYPFVRTVGEYWDERAITGRYTIVHHPVETLSILEPGGGKGGCAKHERAPVKQSAANRKCVFATNAGFFNTTTGACIGNIVTDGEEIQNSGGIQNAHFGIRKDGSLFFGYIPEDMILESEFSQLVSGVIWLIRDGKSFVDVSLKLESHESQETGTLDYFAQVLSARIAIGHDRQGRVVIVYIDGETRKRGVNLYELTELLISWGIVNAINLDGGGSVTALVNGTYVNYPADYRKANDTTIPDIINQYRAVSSIICVHEPDCRVVDCNQHGDCVLGRCHCHANWVGQDCETLVCGHLNCSSHGECTADGCLCYPGFHGEDCQRSCPPNMFGLNCASVCRCGAQSMCEPITGQCLCRPGYTGLACDQECPPGTFGQGCRSLCFCDQSCICHHVTGACNVSLHTSPIGRVGLCVARQVVREQNLVADQSDQFRIWLIAIIVISIVASASLVLNISLLCMGVQDAAGCGGSQGSQARRPSPRRRTYRAANFTDSYSEEDSGNAFK